MKRWLVLAGLMGLGLLAGCDAASEAPPLPPLATPVAATHPPTATPGPSGTPTRTPSPSPTWYPSPVLRILPPNSGGPWTYPTVPRPTPRPPGCGLVWSAVPAPSLGPLYGVSARAADDVWAVGQTADKPTRTLILHWDGATWR